ncbi:hypothetical protein FUAX_00680 [Fulvitalea axinellae]|uniref:FeoB-associated Cys-rich membrane protein n=1 Tax=Fulvitalea axinellae TaxID=1182444 RepID=A0AAU9CFV7_9BACT|nr:hypothetical protein FUAX_00680 [Fulvitalea axinellae]
MDLDIQQFLVALIVIGAIGTIIKKFWPKKDKACGKGCDQCDTAIDPEK